MKLAINEATCMKNSTLMEDLYLAEANDYDFIELRIDMLREYLKTGSLGELAEFFKTHHLKPAGFNSIEDINFSTPEKWQAIEEDLRFVCEVKAAIGGEVLVVVPTISDVEYSEEEVFKDSVTVLNKILAYTDKLKLKIAFEPIGSQNCCVRSLEEAHRITKAVNHSNVGLIVDAFNLYLFDGWQDIDYLEKITPEEIFCYHIDDSDNLPLELLDHAHRLFPGNGVIPLKAISDKLKSIGYDGACSLELFNPSYWQMNARDVFRLGAEKTKEFL
ncbi:sugar phosphate isomerase/epimerase family protein [Enterococcus sp. HY326]|uniref:sugar phosphate isomerase/epimerase family protein n=1 Tax=Enterococcus sp. HY326 TaxID=2971265 RepID=UPI00223FAB7A|nr:sugar phosphate isomerase/epimerase [Enterococcus sp. HY326]